MVSSTAGRLASDGLAVAAGDCTMWPDPNAAGWMRFASVIAATEEVKVTAVTLFGQELHWTSSCITRPVDWWRRSASPVGRLHGCALSDPGWKQHRPRTRAEDVGVPLKSLVSGLVAIS